MSDINAASPATPTTSLADTPQRICLFGGTFDPIHLGHQHIAAAAVDQLHLDLVVFLPCRQSPHKIGQKHAENHHRLAMCQLATAELGWAVVDDFDITAPEPSYSWRTAEAMHNRYPNATLYWLMGTDQWQALPQWNRPERLAELVEFIVFERGNKTTPRPGFRMHAIAGSHPASATDIREGLAAGQFEPWLQPSVLNYIQQNQLYQTSPRIESSG